VLGVAGVDGNGQLELVEAIVRLRKLKSGRVVLDGEDTAHWNMRSFVDHRTAYIPDDRQNDGLILGFDLSRNATLKVFERPPFARRGLVDRAAVDRFTRSLMEAFDVRAPGPQVKAGALSGGNQQKLVLARELSQQPSLSIANKPTRGLKTGAAAYIHRKLLDERAGGAGILLVSADLEEILLLSDRILVMYNGRSMGVLETRSTSIQTLGLMMAGTPLADLKAPGAGS
jgi:simple sugar transport system ATP-binding protein